MSLTGKQRSFLSGLGAAQPPLFQVGKASLTPEFTRAVDEALEAREIVKIALLKSCPDDVRELADTLAGRTRAQIVSVIGRRFVLYRESRKKKRIELP